MVSCPDVAVQALIWQETGSGGRLNNSSQSANKALSEVINADLTAARNRDHLLCKVFSATGIRKSAYYFALQLPRAMPLANSLPSPT
jgi:hypothetical protein